jgi:hypothetical protein
VHESAQWNEELGRWYASFKATHFAGIVRAAVRTLLSHKVVTALARLVTVLAVDIAKSVLIHGRHDLHPDRLVQQSEIVAHVFHTSHTQRTSVPLTATVFRKARHVHDVSTSETSKRFGRVE